MAADIPRYRYRVDRADTLIWVNSLWLAFAKENGAPQLTESILGRCLWDFVAGDDVRRIYQQVHNRVRSTSNSVVMPFRCDSPTLQRHMRMIIQPEADEQILYECQLTKVVSQPYLGIIDNTLTRTHDRLAICSCCKRAMVEPLGWSAAAEISSRLRRFSAKRFPKLCETICPECAETLAHAPECGNGA